MTPAYDYVARRLAEVRDRVAAAARRGGRPPSAIRIVLATKTQPPEAIRAAYEADAREFGENYVQEAQAKHEALGDLAGLRWHLIGHLQTNKARVAASMFDLIQSVDSERLAKALARAHPTPHIRVLIEVNLADEKTKSGVAKDTVERLIASIRNDVDVLGLMTIPPPAANPTDSRRYFVELRELRDRLAVASGLALSDLSMGMTDDFEIAIEEGATIVRIGRGVFGERGK